MNAETYQINGDFYNGIEWFACWLLDNAEGEIITEEKLRPWAIKAWKAKLQTEINKRYIPTPAKKKYMQVNPKTDHEKMDSGDWLTVIAWPIVWLIGIGVMVWVGLRDYGNLK